MASSKTTTDHNEIKAWVLQNGGRPAVVKGTAEGGGILRINFGKFDEDLKPITWKEFFEIFDNEKLAFLYQEETKSGEDSRFNKLVSR